MLGEAADRDQREQRTRQLASATYAARAREAMYGLVFYTMPTAPGPLAFLDVMRIIPDRRTYPELTFEVLHKIYAEPGADSLGGIDEQQVELPSGPALRVRRQRAEPGDPTGQSTVMEGVTYAIRPPGITDAIVVTMTWAALAYGDRLATMADAIAQSVQVTPA
jgi:hypothetical protein